VATLVKDYDSESYDSGAYDEYELGAAPPRVVVVREHPPSKIAAVVKAPDGTKIGRWAEDESKVENVLGSATKTGNMPGGHGEASHGLARDPSQSYPDLALFSAIEWQGAGEEVLWSGGIRQEPQSSGDLNSIEVKAVGDKQFLEDNEEAIGPGFINSDLSRWTGPSTTRRINLLNGTRPHQQDASVTPDAAGDAALHMETQGAWSSPTIPICEAWFDAGSGVDIAAVYGDWINGNANTLFELYVRFCDDDIATGFEGSGDYYTATSGHISQGSADRRRAFIDWLYGESPAGIEGAQFAVDLINLKVVGTQGLALQGEWPDVGFTAKQMLPFIAELAGLTTRDELLEDDGFVIPQAWFDAPGTPMSKLVEVTKYGLLDWFVFEHQLLQYRFPGTYGRKWRLERGSSAPKNSGPDANRVWDGLMVTWQDVDGTTKTAGRPGSGAQFADARLQITDERNAAVAAGRPRRKLLALNGTLTSELAIKTGQRFLEEAANLDQSGEATISGYCQDQNGIWWPAAYVQPGDWAADPGTQNYRKITSANYAHDPKTASVSLGAPPEGLSELEARFNARLIELGFGS
jgi:hypothetical protein